VTSKNFVSFFFTVLFISTAGIILGNIHADLYGLFNGGNAATHFIYGEERTAKYLHSIRYIPENFDGVILGSSVSDNLDTRQLPGYKIYNASINGGNVTDLKPLVENIYRKHNFKLTIVCAHRYLTNDHAKKTDLMTPRQYWSALGSPQLFAAYISRAAVRRGFVSTAYDDYGNLHYGSSVDVSKVRETIDKAVRDIAIGTAAVGNYRVDPVAFSDLREILRTARQHSERLLIFFPPTPALVLAVRQMEVEHYRETISTLLAPPDVVVDFNAPEYSSFRSEAGNFIDAVHMSQSGSSKIISELGRRIPAAVQTAHKQ
jgi:hypothetical protein